MNRALADLTVPSRVPPNAALYIAYLVITKNGVLYSMLISDELCIVQRAAASQKLSIMKSLSTFQIPNPVVIARPRP